MFIRGNDPNYDQLFLALVDHLFNNDFDDIRADKNGYNKPRPIFWKKNNEGQIPNVTATFNNKLLIFEIETSDSIECKESSERWKLFSNYAIVRNFIFTLVTSQACQTQAKKRCKRLNVHEDIWIINTV